MPVMKVSWATAGFILDSAATAFGPCSASSARSGIGTTVQRWPMFATRCFVSASLQAALTTSSRSSARCVIIRSSRMPPAVFVKKA